MTPERMCWNDDERLYQPRIHSRHMRELHRISKELGEPMTCTPDGGSTTGKPVSETAQGAEAWRPFPLVPLFR